MEMLSEPEEADRDQIDRHDVVEQSRHEQNEMPVMRATSGLTT
jgi:hypothetical protein